MDFQDPACPAASPDTIEIPEHEVKVKKVWFTSRRICLMSLEKSWAWSFLFCGQNRGGGASIRTWNANCHQLPS